MSFRSLWLFVLFALSFASAPAAQGGYAKQDFPRYGLEDLPVPKRWDAIPVEPTEKRVVLSWAEELPDERDRKARRRQRPTLDLVVLDLSGKQAEDEGTDSDAVVSVLRYLRSLSRLGEWTQLGETEELDEEAGRTRRIRRFRGKGPGASGVTWVFEWNTADRVQFLLGRCHEDDLDELAKIWRHMATRVKLVDPVEPDMSKWVRFYERKPKFLDPAFRLEARKRLEDVKGWKAEDTENYLIVYSTKDKALIRVLKRELEAIRRAYEEIFPPTEPVRNVSVLRVCKDKAEYQAYGGPAGSGGYWSPVAEELVFFDYEDEGRKRGSGKANSRIVLYHEALHQYVHYAAGDLAPHSWFNEGTGDFFSGARFDSSGSVSKIGINPWRIEAIQYFVENGRTLSLGDLFEASKREFYAKADVCYAQAWSLVYFLRTSREVRKHPKWSRIHPRYYEALKEEWAARRLVLEEDGVAPYTAPYLEAQAEARDRALEIALFQVDLPELERAWAAFVHELDD